MGRPDTAVVTGSVLSAAVSLLPQWQSEHSLRQRVEVLCLPASVCVSRNLEMGFLPFFFLSISCLAQIPWLCWHEKAGFTASLLIKEDIISEERMLLQNSFQAASLWFPHIVGIQMLGLLVAAYQTVTVVSHSTYCWLIQFGRDCFHPHGVCCHWTVQVDWAFICLVSLSSPISPFSSLSGISHSLRQLGFLWSGCFQRCWSWSYQGMLELTSGSRQLSHILWSYGRSVSGEGTVQGMAIARVVDLSQWTFSDINGRWHLCWPVQDFIIQW